MPFVWGCVSFVSTWFAAAGLLAVLTAREDSPFRELAGMLLAVLWIALFGLGGLVSFCMFARRLSAQVGMGKITVEVSEHPVYPGRTFRGLLHRSGRRKTVWLQASLLCEEWWRPVYASGESGDYVPPPESVVVYRRQLALLEGAETDPEARQEAEFELQIPPRAMHSFEADDYKGGIDKGSFSLNWYILVKGRVGGVAVTDRAFRVVVYPHDYAREHV